MVPKCYVCFRPGEVCAGRWRQAAIMHASSIVIVTPPAITPPCTPGTTTFRRAGRFALPAPQPQLILSLAQGGLQFHSTMKNLLRTLKAMVPNLYPATVKKEDADSIRLGEWKTGLYFLVMIAAVAGVALFNGTRSTIVNETVGSSTAPITATQCKVSGTLSQKPNPYVRAPHATSAMRISHPQQPVSAWSQTRSLTRFASPPSLRSPQQTTRSRERIRAARVRRARLHWENLWTWT